MDEFGTDHPTVVPLQGIEVGKNYAMVITTSCGLWRYLIGDTVMFTSKNPYKFVITGRTKYFINAFGEELIMDNAEKGLKYACEKTGAQVAEYTAAPVFMDVMPSAATSGSLSSPRSQQALTSLHPCSTSICRKSTATMRPSVSTTSHFSIWR